MIVAVCVLAGLYGVLVGVGIGYLLFRKVKSAPVVTHSVEELEKIRQEREDMIAEQEAFLRLVGYNADIAYGLDENPLKGS